MKLIACRKILPYANRRADRRIVKLLMIMRLTAILVLAACLQISAKGIVAQGITITQKNAPLQKALEEFKRQSGYFVFYDDSLLQKGKPASINIRNATVVEALNSIFESQELTYEIVGKRIIAVKEKETYYHPSASLQPVALEIKGKVLDKSGVPLEGVTVALLKAQGLITRTNQDGNFSIRSEKDSGALVFSHVTYETQTVSFKKGQNSSLTLTIVLKELPVSLNDVVVIGYGNVKKKDLTGSVSQVDMNDLRKAPVKSFDEALAGRLAGVQVSGNDGEPGTLSNIVIRGGNSVTQDNSPLYVVDGFPLESFDFNSLNPEDIESIDVLKDASATAIYGTRGANGVIIITTKKGKAGRPIISYNGYYGLQQISRKMEMMTPYEFVKYQLEYNPDAATQTYLSGGKSLDEYKNVNGINFQDEVFRTAPMQNHSLSMRGGNDNTKYSLSGNIRNQDGIFLNSGFNRYQGRLTLDQTVNKKLKVGINVNYSNTTSYGTKIGSDESDESLNLLFGVWGYRPVSGDDSIDLLNDLTDPDNSTANYSTNPLLNAQNAYRSSNVNSMIGNAYAEYAFTPRLKLRVTGGINNNTSQSEIFNNSLTTRGNPRLPDGSNGSIMNTISNNWLNENTLSYNRTFERNHHLNLVGGITFQQNKTTLNGFTGSRVPNEILGIDGLDEAPEIIASSARSMWTLVSFLGRVNYDFKNKYLFTVSFRADGSSKFADNNRWGYFPSAAFAWRMSDEKAIKEIKWISDAKLRASYGITGNNRIDPYAYLSQLITSNANGYSYNNGTSSVGVGLAELGNPDIKWETTSQVDIGYDLSLFKNNVSVTVDVYSKTTKDLLLNTQLPYTLGVGSTAGASDGFKNIGRTRNSGLEISLSTTNLKTKNFSWSSAFNISFNRNKLLELTQNQNSLLTGARFAANYNSLFPYIAVVDQPVSQMYGLIWEGNYQYSDFDNLPDGRYLLKSSLSTNGDVRTDIRPGDIKYRDLNGDKVVDIKDYTVIGRAQPIHTGGFSNNFTYKSFDLNVLFQWSYGNNLINANRLLFEGNGKNVVNVNQYASYEDHWEPDNQTNKNFRPKGNGPAAFSTRIIEDGSYLRLKTVALGYTFSTHLLTKLKVNELRVYVSGQNLYTWTKYGGSDPEVSVRNSALTPGFDYAAYPRARTGVVGLNLSF